MERPSDNRPSDAAVGEFLIDYHGAAPADLEHLSGGFWSAAYGYRVGDDELVLRLSDRPDGFCHDQAAMRYSAPSLPVPEVLDIGEGLGRWFAVSRRHHGEVLEDFHSDQAPVLGPTVVRLLAALRETPDEGAQVTPWRQWLLDGIADPSDRVTHGWHARLAEDDRAGRIFDAVDRRIRSSIDACTDRRQLVHGDLLHANVLVAPSADAITAVFSWKCSTWGDALYDLAWCTFWGRWHPGIGDLDLWDRVVSGLAPADLVDASTRHHVYELQIGASHLGWYLMVDDPGSLAWTLDQLDEILETGAPR